MEASGVDSKSPPSPSPFSTRRRDTHRKHLKENSKIARFLGCRLAHEMRMEARLIAVERTCYDFRFNVVQLSFLQPLRGLNEVFLQRR